MVALLLLTLEPARFVVTVSSGLDLRRKLEAARPGPPVMALEIGAPTLMDGGTGMARHIVVVESDLDLVVVYRALFGDAGYALHWAGDLLTARVMLRRPPPPDLLILNGLVPDDTTLAFCREQRAAWPLLPIVLTSTQPQDRAAALAAGADFVVVKPFDVEDLLTRVNSLLLHRPGPCGWASGASGGAQA